MNTRKEMVSEQPIRCAVIGIGGMGRKYAVMLNNGRIQGMQLVAVCTHTRENCAWAKETLNESVRIFESEDELYTYSDGFDAVLIATPHKLHPAMTIRALKAGKHVMCDKPMGTTAEDARSMQEAAERAGTVYAMMCQQRSYAAHRKIKELLDSNAIGQIMRAGLIDSGFFRTSFYHRSGEWRSSWSGEGGGMILNQGHHLLDLWLWLFGSPQAVYADIPFGKYNEFMVDDEATLVLDYPGKVTGTIILTTGEGGITKRLEIAGTKGRILLDDKTLSITRFDMDSRSYAKTAQVVSRQQLGMQTECILFDKDEHAYESMLQNFEAAIHNREPLIAPGGDGIATLELINAAYLSAWEGCRLRLPVDNERYLTKLREMEERERKESQ